MVEVHGSSKHQLIAMLQQLPPWKGLKYRPKEQGELTCWAAVPAAIMMGLTLAGDQAMLAAMSISFTFMLLLSPGEHWKIWILSNEEIRANQQNTFYDKVSIL